MVLSLELNEIKLKPDSSHLNLSFRCFDIDFHSNAIHKMIDLIVNAGPFIFIPIVILISISFALLHSRNDQDEWCVHEVKLNYISLWNERQPFYGCGCSGSFRIVYNIPCIIHMYLVPMYHLLMSFASFDIFCIFFSFPLFSIFKFLFLQIHFNGFNKFFLSPAPSQFPYVAFTSIRWTDMEINGTARMRDPFQECEMWQRKIMSS